MEELLEISNRNLAKARAIIDELGIEQAWTGIGATANLVGSVRTGLMMDHLDIDYHVYSEPFRITDSFAAVARIAADDRISEVIYRNLLNEEDRCLAWHLRYRDDEGRPWVIDMMHIMNDSRYAGKFERVADRISAVMTAETRLKILGLKREVFRRGAAIHGTEIYRAVIEQGITGLDELLAWKKGRPEEGIIVWEPGARPVE